MQSKSRVRSRRSSKKIRYPVFLLLLIAASAAVAYLVYTSAQRVVASWELTALGGISIQSTTRPGSTPAPTSSLPVGAAQGSILPTPDPWIGATRVTVLIMGLDYRDWEDNQGPPRSDTMILLTVDPISRTAGMLSIPRDLWVNIPGMGYNKINTAIRWGDLYKLPGAGPGLAMKTVENFLGVPINFYAVLDFHSFERFIDEIGGVEVDIPEEISVDPLGPHNTVYLKPGVQLLDGPVALAYARNRYTANDDTDRSARQQQVIFAIRDRILSADMLPQLVLKAPALYQELSSGIRTNMTLQQAIQLAWLASSVQRENIKNVVLGPQQMLSAKSPDGLDIYKPITAKVRLARDEIFTSSDAAGPAAPGSSQDLVKGEQARLSLVNASGVPDLGSRTASFLESKGITIQDVSNSADVVLASKIVDHTGKPYTLDYLVKLVNIQPGDIKIKYTPDSPSDLELVIGKDWARTNPLP
jgi:LCP family protein required for cell wall assembly